MITQQVISCFIDLCHQGYVTATPRVTCAPISDPRLQPRVRECADGLREIARRLNQREHRVVSERGGVILAPGERAPVEAILAIVELEGA